MKWALLVVDVQRDFCEGGPLSIGDTASLLGPLLSTIELARNCGLMVIFTQDWHPSDHGSFVTHGGRWPVHCVAGSPGADLEPPLEAGQKDLVIRKGQHPNEEGYSAFESNTLAQQLRSRDVDSLAICGIATDFCVLATAIDSAKLGFKTDVLVDLTRAVDPARSVNRLSEMERAGITLTQSRDWLQCACQ